MRGTKEKPWAGIGVEVNRSLSSREMLYKAKLDWEVSKIPSQRPKSHSNQETLRFYKAYFDAGNAEIETIGSLDGARINWAIARLNQRFILCCCVELYLRLRNLCHVLKSTYPTCKKREKFENFHENQ